jgi:uridine kinase
MDQEEKLKNILAGLEGSEKTINNLLESGLFSLVEEDLSETGLIEKLVGIFKRLEKGGTKIILFIGGAASGKTTFVKKLASALPSTNTISPDSFLVRDRKWRRAEIVAKNKSPLLKYDFAEMKRAVERIVNLKRGEGVLLPELDDQTGKALALGKENYTLKVEKSDYLIIEGDFQPIPGDLLIYFHVPDEIRNRYRLKRDSTVRGQANIDGLLKNLRVRHERQHLPFTLPMAQKADWLITVKPEKTEKGYQNKCWLYQRTF